MQCRKGCPKGGHYLCHYLTKPLLAAWARHPREDCHSMPLFTLQTFARCTHVTTLKFLSIQPLYSVQDQPWSTSYHIFIDGPAII